MRRRLAFVAAACAMSASACGVTMTTSEERAAKMSATTTTEAAQYGSPALIPTTTTVVVRDVAPPATTAQPPASIVERVDDAPVNRSQRQDASGWFLTLVSNGASTFRATDRVAFELTFENRSNPPRTLAQDSNQTIRFALYRQAEDGSWQTAWSNMKCRSTLRPEERPYTGIVETEPGEKGSFIDEYPSTTETDNDCGVGAGTYLLVGFLDWCPEESIRRSEYNDARYCEPGAAKKVQSAPLRIELTP